MPSRIVAPLLVAGLLAAVAGHAQAQIFEPLAPLELKCQLAVAKAEAKFVNAKTKCVAHCFYDFWHSGSMSSYADCLPPYGGETATCIDDPLKGAEARYSGLIAKCALPTKDCPECYSGGDCTAEAASRPPTVGSEYDPFVPAIYCERSSAMPQEQKCQLNVAKQIAKLVALEHKCYAKCQSNAVKGLNSAEACQPPASDGITQLCIGTAKAKTALAIDKKCDDAEVPHSTPECDDASTYPNGEAWADVATLWVSGDVVSRYCGSASGAFVD
jgi:hypothetical protein